MIKEVIGVGETIELATEDARKQLGIDETADVEIEVIQRPEKKKFGLFGGSPAKVKLTVKETPAEAAESFLRKVLDCMKLENVEIKAEEIENGTKFDLEGEDVGFVIGRRGETLDSLQYLTSLVANHTGNSYYKITLNTGDYREKREKTLEILGRKLAFKAIKTGRKTSLEPMNPYERRIIHTSVQNVNGAISWSEGENAERHVVIGPDPKAKRYSGNSYGGGYNNRGGYKGKGGRRPYNNNRSFNKDYEVDPDRKPLNEGGEGNLYGRIDK